MRILRIMVFKAVSTVNTSPQICGGRQGTYQPIRMCQSLKDSIASDMMLVVPIASLAHVQRAMTKPETLGKRPLSPVSRIVKTKHAKER